MHKASINFVIHPFENLDDFLDALSNTRLLQQAPEFVQLDLLGTVKRAYESIATQFPDGVEQTEENFAKLPNIGNLLPKGTQAVAKNSFLTNLAAYAHASRDLLALVKGLGDIVRALQKVPYSKFSNDPDLLNFLKAFQEASHRMEKIIVQDDKACQCPGCLAAAELLKKKAGPKVIVKAYDEDDPDMPQEVKDAVEHIKEHGEPAGLPEGMAFAISYDKPETWDEELAKLPFPQDAKDSLLAELRKQYRKHTGKFAPGDPALRNN